MAKPIAITTTSALAKKMRLVSEKMRLMPRSADDPEVGLDGFTIANGDRPRFGVAQLAPDQQRVRTGWHGANRVSAVVIGDGKETVAEDEDIRAHVRVDVA